MVKRIATAVGAVSALLLLLAVAGLVWAHVAIRRERTPLPSAGEVVAALEAETGPTRVSWINTASQPMPRAGVLDAGRDPAPTEPYTMAHPAFVLEWGDGRILLIDSGMTRDGAAEFGATIEQLAGGEPITVHTPVAERLADRRARVRGAIFSHLHTDHVGGLPDVCRGLAEPVTVFMSEAQMERPNYTTRGGRRLLEEAGCLRLARLGGLSSKEVEGFPGVRVVAAGGHTPGSQIVLATVGEGAARRRFAFAGDIVNHADGIAYDVPKPLLYRTLIVPEDEGRQGELRRWLRELQQQHAFTVLPAHDQHQIERSGVPPWQP